MQKSTWPTPELQTAALNAVKKYGAELLKAKPIDAKEYGVTVPTAEFYAELLGALCKFESNYKPEETYEENFKDGKGKPVISRGLLQISIESANGYGAKLKSAEQLHDIDTNLKCGVLIMSKWISKDGRISGKSSSTGSWLGMARYWSPFRKSDRVEKMRAAMREIF